MTEDIALASATNIARSIHAFRAAMSSARIQDGVKRAWEAHIHPIRDVLPREMLRALAAEYDERIISLPAWVDGE